VGGSSDERTDRDVVICTHDLRRTAASYMTSLGISRLVVAKILNHVERGVTAVYDRHLYDQEKQAALGTWAIAIDSITAASRQDTAATLPYCTSRLLKNSRLASR
jgi:hypothetical protein